MVEQKGDHRLGMVSEQVDEYRDDKREAMTGQGGNSRAGGGTMTDQGCDDRAKGQRQNRGLWLRVADDIWHHRYCREEQRLGCNILLLLHSLMVLDSVSSPSDETGNRSHVCIFHLSRLGGSNAK